MNIKIFSRKWTVRFLIAAAIVVALWDIFASPTESSIIRHWGNVSMAFPWSIGMLVGHWFLPWGLFRWEKGDPPDAIVWKTVVNFSFMLSLILLDVNNHYTIVKIGYIGIPMAWLWVGVGLIFGHWFWGQGKEKV